MAIKTRAQLKALFENGDQPDANAFIDLVDSFCHMSEALPAIDGGALTNVAPSQWVSVSGALTYVSAESFIQAGDLTATYLFTRRTRLTLTPGGDVYAAVLASSYDAFNDETTVTLDDGIATANLSAVAVSFATPTSDGGALSTQMLGGLKQSEITGLLLSNNAIDAVNDIDIAAGACRDDSDTNDMFLDAALTKRLDAAWAVGDNQGGLLAPDVKADFTPYAVWLIMRTDTGIVDVAFSTSFTAPTMPANYDRKRLIGFICTGDPVNGIRTFVQVGDYFRYLTATVADVTDTTIADGVYETGWLPLPPKCLAEFIADASGFAATSTNSSIIIRPIGAGGTAHRYGFNVNGAALGAIDGLGMYGWVYLDNDSQFEYGIEQTANVPTSFNVYAIGCLMLSRSSLS